MAVYTRASDLTREAKGKIMVEFLNTSHSAIILFLFPSYISCVDVVWHGNDDTNFQLTMPVLLLRIHDRKLI